MKKYFQFFLPYKKALILAPLLVIIDVICEIVQPDLMSKIVDNGVGHKDMAYILQVGGIMVALSVIAIGANVGNIYYSSHASVGFAAELRKGMFGKIQEFSFANLDKFSSASLTTRLTNDVNIVQEVIMMSLRLLIRAPLMLLFAVVIAISINAGLAIVIAVAIPVLAICMYVILRKGFPYFERMQKKLDKVNAVVQENLVNIRVVKSFVREDFEKKKFGHTNNELREMAVKASGMVVLILPVMQLVMNISIVAIVWFGGNAIISGSFQVGQLMSFITYITQILMSLMMLSMTIMTFSRAEASSDRILEILNTSVDIVDSAAAKEKNLQVKQGKVEFKDVYFKYHPKGDEFVLKNINLVVNGGETVAIIGATGSSKSTLVQLIPRLYDVTSGHVLIDGIDVRDYTLPNLRKNLKLVLQQNELFSGTIKQNLKWGNQQASDEEIISAAKDAQAHDFIMSFPEQYETLLGQSGVNVSGGQKQRLCIARAILRKPAILILDDSTSAVDTATEARIRASFSQHLKGTTTFIIAQRISSIQAADRIILLDDGAIIGFGSHNELIKTSPVYQEIYNSQQIKTDDNE
ncbi:ABC transporter ATP-binding protein [Mucilaginibacter lappiensis]|uniref:ATP-binding cassette subfamily B protein n=1 Tax=Mucilaginibacter lappiensis TaxID=354630 RepID=A0A841JJM6_9SPHI|nr:ABC transporter ATP-binding protein [Mucilaginibacter lappiensis]MBB6130684.1 ATP-binding cassette subfamily B protein [Mucilaginibacter lappiensis]